MVKLATEWMEPSRSLNPTPDSLLGVACPCPRSETDTLKLAAAYVPTLLLMVMTAIVSTLGVYAGQAISRWMGE
jgi:hypothetical protein